MGEAEDIVRRRNEVGQRRQATTADAKAAEEKRYIDGKLRRMLPKAVANLRKRQYDVPGQTWVTVDGERRVAWLLVSVDLSSNWDYPDRQAWYLLSDGVIVMEYRGTVTRQVTVPNTEALLSLDDIICHPRRKPKPVLRKVDDVLRRY